MENENAFNEEVSKALTTVGLPATPPGLSLNRIASRMAKVLGIDDLVKGQRLASTDEARRVAQTYAASVALTLRDEGVRWSDGGEMDGMLEARFGVRKFIIAAGRSSRYSPTELIHKQVARPDGSSTNIAQSRLAAQVGTLQDVVVIDPMVAYRLLARIPIEGATEDGMLDDVGAAFDRVVAALRKKTLLASLRDDVLELVASQLRFARHPDQQDDLADVTRRLSAKLAGVPGLTQVEARAVADEVGFAIAVWLVETEDYTSESDVEDLCGPDCILAVASPHGPGAAYMAGVRRLRELGVLDAARYSFCIYSDYPAFLLDKYPNLYLNTYLRAVNRFEFQQDEDVLWPAMPVITVGAKQPPDTVQERGNIILKDTPLGVVPQAIREWRDMCASERGQAQERLAAGQHAINAGLFFIDTPWAESQFGLMREAFDHPDPKKGKPYEYWYTDLVAIAAGEDAPRRVVWVGEGAPRGNKTVGLSLSYRESIHDMMRRKLLALGVSIDPGARINVVVREPDVDLDLAIRAIFGGTRRRRAHPDQVFMAGEVEMDSTVRIDNGVVLDGRRGPVVLKGETAVGRGTCLRHVTAEDTEFQPCMTLDGYSYEPPRLGIERSPTLLADSRLTLCCVQTGAVVKDSLLIQSYAAGRVVDCELVGTVVAADEELMGVTVQGRRSTLAATIYNPEYYVPGLASLHEVPEPERERTLSRARRVLQETLKERVAAVAVRSLAMENARFFFTRCPFLSGLTAELIGHFSEGELRSAVGGDPYLKLKREVAEAVRQGASHEWRRIETLPADPPSLADELQRLVRLAVQANAIVPESVATQKAFQPIDGKVGLADLLDALTDRSLGIEDFQIMRSMALEGGPGTFVYVLDSVGEAEADGLLCALLCHLGHRVLMVAKSRPVGSCATCDDVEEMIRALPVLHRLRGEGRLRVVESGSFTRGVLLDRPGRELEAALVSDVLKGVILKGQDNLYTTCARNRLKAPAMALLVPKDEAGCRVAGVEGGKSGGAGVLAFVPAGEPVVTVHSDGTMEGSLRELSERARRPRLHAHC